MSLKRMTNEEMVSLTRTLVEPGHADRKTLETLPELAAFMPRLEGVHLGLLTMQSQVEGVRVTSIGVEQKRKDQRHDGLARGIWYGLEAYKYLARDDARAAALAETQAVLFSDGLRVVSYSYRETAGYAQLLASRLEPRHKDLLASLPWSPGTMLDLVNEWMAVARELGDLENERTRHIPDPARPGNVVQARMRWIRAIHALRGMIDVAGTSDPALLRIVQRIAEMEAVARRRAGGGVGEIGEDEGNEDPALPGDDVQAPDDTSGGGAPPSTLN